MVGLYIAGETKDQVGGQVDWFVVSGVYRCCCSVAPSSVKDLVGAYGSGGLFREPLISRST